MTPKEKADEIFNHYHNLIQETGGELGEEILVSILAKECALYSINLILKETFEFTKENSNNFIYIYWLRVKDEIEKL